MNVIEFNTLPWHDSELLAWNVVGGVDEPTVTLDLLFPRSETPL